MSEPATQSPCAWQTVHSLSKHVHHSVFNIGYEIPSIVKYLFKKIKKERKN